MKKRLLSMLLVFSMLVGLCTSAFAAAVPIPTDGARVTADDVRVDGIGTEKSATFQVVLDYDTAKWTQGYSAAIKLTVPADSTGISSTNLAKLESFEGAGQARITASTSSFANSGSGQISVLQITGATVKLNFKVPNVTATSKITVEIPGDQSVSGIPVGGTKSVKIAKANIAVETGSIIVQYPVTVNVEGTVPTGASVTVNTTDYNGKATYDKAGNAKTLASGDQFWVDSGAGQQNTPVLNITAPSGYYAQIKIGSGSYVNAAGSVSIGEIAAVETVTVTFKEGSAPVEEMTNISVTDSTAEGWTLSKWDTALAKNGSVNTVSAKDYVGYTARGYKINGGAEQPLVDGKVTVDLTATNTQIEFIYERTGNTVVVPGLDGEIAAPKDADNVTVQPTDDTKTPSIDAGTKDVTVPEGGATVTGPSGSTVVPADTIVTPEGKIKLPGTSDTDQPIEPGKTNPLPAGFYTVTYKSNEGTGNLPVQIVKENSTAQALGIPASFQITGREFVSWNTMLAGSGDTYKEGDNLPTTGNLILWAQWKDKGADYGENKITITFKSNTQSNETAEQILGDPAATTFKGTLTPDKSFSAPQGWTLVAWNTQADGNGDLYKLNSQITRTKAEGDLTLYAQWVKNEDNAITVPGSDNLPGTDEDVTAKGSETEQPRRDEGTGTITVPSGGSAVKGNEEIDMPNGGTVKPDGTITIKQPDGSDITIKPDGSTETKDPDGSTSQKRAFKVTYDSGTANQGSKVVFAVDSATIADGEAMFPDFAGHKFAYWKSDDVIMAVGSTLDKETTLIANWYAVDDSGDIVIKPDPDKEPDKEIIVKPNPDGSKPEPGEDGTIEVKPGGSIEIKPKEPNGGTIELPEGGKVNPDGTITDKDNNTYDPAKPETWPDGYFMVKYDANGGTGEMSKQLGKTITAKVNTFTRDGFQFNIWNTAAEGKGTSYKENASIPYPGTKGQTITLYALWYKQNTDGSIVHPGADGKFEPDGEKDDVTVKPGPGGTVDKPDDKGNIKVPDEGTIVLPDGTEITPPPGTVITPDGKIEFPDKKPDGSGETVDPSKPGELPTGYFYVTYKAGEGTGADRKQMAKTGDKALGGTIFTAPANKFFASWKVENADKGVNPGDSLTLTADLVLVAQWRGNGAENPDLTYGATVKYYRSASDTNPTVESHKSNSNPMHFQIKNGDILQDTSWSSVADGWTLKGWSNKAGDKFYALGSSLQMSDGETFDMYAVWTKADGDNVVVPGPDGKPGGGDDITIKPNPDDPTKKPEVQPDGSVKVPDGGEIIIPGANSPADDKTITVKPGATVKPDGSIELPDGGTASIKPDGTTITGPGTIDPGKLPTPNPDPDKPYEPGNGTIVLPGKDGQVDTKDDVIIKPATGEINKDTGDVTTKGDNTEIKYPSAPDGNGATVKVPEGTVIKPDGTIDNIPNPGGTIILPDGSEITVPGGSKVDPDGTITIPDGGKGEVKDPDGNKSEIPGGSKVDKDGNIILPDGGTMKPDGSFKYTVVLKSTSGTTLTANGFNATIWVKKDAEQTIVAPAVSGYLITGASSVTVIGGQQVEGGYTITFTYKTEATGGGGGGGSSTTSYIIKATAGIGGSISPSGNVSVVRGSDKVFSIIAANGYKIADVLVDGRSVGARSTYTFEDVRNAHTIEAVFAQTTASSSVADPSETGVANWLKVADHSAYLTGYGDGVFGPSDNMTRAQVAQMFYNLLLDQNVTVTTNFSDVPANAWYAKAVNALASLGILNGTGENKFDPDRAISRAEFTAIAMRFAKASAAVTNPFTDVASNDWYYNAVTSAVSYGWINGYSDGTFRPQATITRAEVATIVNRMLNRTADHDFVNSNATTYFVDVPSTYWAYYNIMEATTSHAHTIGSDGVETWNRLK